jgi:hypothetical protein
MAAPEFDALAFNHGFAASSPVFDSFDRKQGLIVLGERAAPEGIDLGMNAIHQLLQRQAKIPAEALLEPRLAEHLAGPVELFGQAIGEDDETSTVMFETYD